MPLSLQKHHSDAVSLFLMQLLSLEAIRGNGSSGWESDIKQLPPQPTDSRWTFRSEVTFPSPGDTGLFSA